MIERCAEMGKLLKVLLRRTFEQCKYVGDIRGRLLLWGIEFVNNRKDKSTFDTSFRFGVRVQQPVFKREVAAYPRGATVNGTHGIISPQPPPCTVTEMQLEESVTVLKDAYDSEDRRVKYSFSASDCGY